MRVLKSRPPFAPLERDTVQLKVYDRLREALMAGLFEPGHVLIVRALAEEFRTSQMPVRDALSRLVAEQALEILPSRSLAVPVLSHERWQEVQSLRVMLEGTAAALAVPRLTASVIRDLSEANKAMRRAVEKRDGRNYLESNRRFHFTLYRAANRPVMLQVIEGLWLKIGPPIRQGIDTMFAAKSVDTGKTLKHHEEVLDAIARQDPPAARQGIESDIRDALTLHLPKLADREIA